MERLIEERRKNPGEVTVVNIKLIGRDQEQILLLKVVQLLAFHPGI